MGEELNRRRMPIPMTPMATARALTRSVWPVVARINGEFEPHGTGFLISHSGLVMTARHVVEPPAQKRSRSLGPDGWFDEGDLFVLIVSRPNSHGGQALPAIVRIERINFMTRGDIAICHAARANGSRPSDIDALILHPGLPKKGEKVWTFGYKELDPSVRVETIEELEVHTNPEGLLTAGVVEEVHIPRKPNSFTDFPCFTISAEIFGGMSGSPVFNSEGRVLGVISASPDWEKTATVALVGYSLATTLHFPAGAKAPLKKRLLRDLIRDGTVHSDPSVNEVIIASAGNDQYSIAFLGP
jgi:hypothetical protein